MSCSRCRPKPLYHSTASQLGLHRTRGIPSLLDFVLPRTAPQVCPIPGAHAVPVALHPEVLRVVWLPHGITQCLSTRAGVSLMGAAPAAAAALASCGRCHLECSQLPCRSLLKPPFLTSLQVLHVLTIARSSPACNDTPQMCTCHREPRIDALGLVAGKSLSEDSL